MIQSEPSGGSRVRESRISLRKAPNPESLSHGFAALVPF
jgi:hypothetical protein